MIRNHWKKVVFFVLVVGMVSGIAITTQTAGTPMPNEEDMQKTNRVIAPLTGGRDVRMELPSGGMIGAAGIVEPRDREAKLTFQVPGLVEVVLVHEGEQVTTTTALVQLRADYERASVDAATADVRAARAQLDKTLRGTRREDVEAADGDATAARVRAEGSAETLDRTRRLFERGAAAKEELERAQSQAASDKATASALAARYRSLTKGSRTEDISLARANLLLAEARLAQASAALERLTLRAPSDGEVLQILVRPGEYVNPAAENVVTLADTSKMRVRLDVDERDVGRISLGMKGYVMAEAMPERRFPGSVVEIGRRMGRKNVRTDESTERLDTKILEVLMELDERPTLPQGLRVTGFLSTDLGKARVVPGADRSGDGE